MQTEWRRKELVPNGNLTASVWGPTKVGKTTLALTFPEPLFIVNADRSMDHLLAKLGDKEYYYIDLVPEGLEVDMPVAKALYANVRRLILEAITVGKGSIIIDGGVRFWDVITEAFVPNKDDGAMPKAYQKANSEYENLLDDIVNSPLNLIITNQQKPIYAGATKNTGEFEMAGFSRLPYWVFSILKGIKIKNVDGSRTHAIEFGDNGYDTRLEGRILKNPTFEKLYALSYPNHNPELNEALWMEWAVD